MLALATLSRLTFAPTDHPAATDDWLVSTTAVSQYPTTFSLRPAPEPYPSGSQLLTLANGLVERTFFAGADGAFCTVEYRHLLSHQTYFRAIAPEGNITLNGTALQIGGCDGQPTGHAEFFTPETYGPQLSAADDTLLLENISHGAPAALFDWQPGRRRAPSDVAWPPTGVHVTVNFRVPDAPRFAKLRAARVSVHYEMYDGMPVLRKWVEVSHAGSSSGGGSAGGGAGGGAGDAAAAADGSDDDVQKPLVVDTLNYEMLRAPNFGPEAMTIVQQQANNPTPFDQQPRGGNPSFPGRDFSLWFLDPDYDACCDHELHVTYTLFTFLIVGYTANKQFGGPTGPGALVHPGGTPFASLSVRTVLHDSTSSERQGLGVRMMHRKLAPQLLEQPVPFMIQDITSSAAMRLAVDQASDAGYELVIVGFGAAGWCGMCFGQLDNATFRGWFKGEVGYARSKGVEVSAYTLMQHNGWGESIPTAEQTLARDGVTRGPTACFATDWHATYRQAVLDFVTETGMGGLETDGQYESIPCADESHDHHHNGIAGAWHYGLEATLDFNRRLKGIRSDGDGVYQTGADAYCFSGANKWNHADTDAFGHLPLWEQHTMGRLYVYDSTLNRLPASGTIGVNDLATSSKTCMGDPSTGAPPTTRAQRLSCFDFILGAQYLMGSIPTSRAARLYDPADEDAAALRAILSKWTDFYKRHYAPRPSGAAGVLAASLLHLRRPDSRSLEAVLHVTADASLPSRALLALANPTPKPTPTERLLLPLYYAGLGPGAVVKVTRVDLSAGLTHPTTVVHDSGGRKQQQKQPPPQPSHPTHPSAAPQRHVVGGDQGAGPTDIVLEGVTLPPRSYAAYLIELAS